MKFAIIANETKTGALELSEEIKDWFINKEVEATFLKNQSFVNGSLDSISKDRMKNVDLIIVLGGDGTLLNAAQVFYEYDIPLIGINFGHLGFLTSLEKDNLYDGLEKIVKSDYIIEERMMLDVQLVRNEKLIGDYIALNDAVVSKNSLARMIDMEISVNSKKVDQYAADGLILSTPTGSTAYSLSAGGPIVEPSVSAIILTPICAHNLYSRPMVVSDREILGVKIVESSADITLTIDGQLGVTLYNEDQVVVQKGEKYIKFARFEGRSFYQILHEKFSRTTK